MTSFDRQLENVYATTARSIVEFVQWVKQQPFYEKTPRLSSSATT